MLPKSFNSTEECDFLKFLSTIESTRAYCRNSCRNLYFRSCIFCRIKIELCLFLVIQSTITIQIEIIVARPILYSNGFHACKSTLGYIAVFISHQLVSCNRCYILINFKTCIFIAVYSPWVVIRTVCNGRRYTT